MKRLPIIFLSLFMLLTGCMREPELHLYEGGEVDIVMPFFELNLETYWNYELVYGVEYDWKAEWRYGWDELDVRTFGDIGYTLPSVYNIRRYYTGTVPGAPHTTVLSDQIYSNFFSGRYDWGFWDVLIWNDIVTKDDVQSLIFDEATTLDSVFAFTNQSMRSTRYEAPKYTRAFYAPEELYSAYVQGVDINPNLDGFEYDEERHVWVKKLDMVLAPITYIYLTQVILHNNRGRVTGIDGASNLSGMSRSTNINTGKAGPDNITVAYNSLFKTGCDNDGETVDIAGGRLLTFGICNLAANKVTSPDQIKDNNSHYMDINFRFSNGMDSTFVFNVTDQVRKRFKGGVITVELDMDTVPIPKRKGGSGFDAVVKDYENGGVHEFELKND